MFNHYVLLDLGHDEFCNNGFPVLDPARSTGLVMLVAVLPLAAAPRAARIDVLAAGVASAVLVVMVVLALGVLYFY